MGLIHPTAVIDSSAEIGAGCEVGPFSVVGPHVTLGEECVVGSHVVIEGHTRVGKRNRIFQFASVGAQPQDKKFTGEPSTLELGDDNMIREYVTLQPGTAHGTMRTVIGNNNLFMACSHVGHDCRIGNNNIFANSVALSGHVTVGNGANIGGLTGIHQFVRIGDNAFMGAGSMVTKDIPPFCIAQGDRAGLVGINKIGLQRAGVSSDEIRVLTRLFRSIFVAPGRLQEKADRLREEAKGWDRAEAFVAFIVDGSGRGITGSRRDTRKESE